MLARWQRVVVLVLSLCGTAALFLPFTAGFSPLDAAADAVMPRALPFAYLFLVLPLLLPIPAGAWQIRKLATGNVSPIQIAAAYMASTGALLSVSWFVGLAVVTEEAFPQSLNQLSSTVMCIALVGINLVMLVRNRQFGESREATAETFLLGGYLPTSVFCLVMWYPREIFSGWEVGAYVIAVVTIGYATAMVVLWWRMPKLAARGSRVA